MVFKRNLNNCKVPFPTYKSKAKSFLVYATQIIELNSTLKLNFYTFKGFVWQGLVYFHSQENTQIIKKGLKIHYY